MDGPDLSVSQARRVPHRRRPLMPLSSRPSNYNLRSHGEATAVDAAPVVNENEEEQAEIVEEELVSSNMASNVFRLETFKGDGTQKIDTEVTVLTVRGKISPTIELEWDKFSLLNKLTNKTIHVDNLHSISYFKGKKLRNILKTTYSVHFFIQHENFLIPIN